ncbi:MAG: bifunctional phosphopantothenoylcysteine decarboxylase/phosphopantothenate--cysteine ligase CoaBC [Candidatus Bathyarchaeota archaeon]|nr:bifunctional phosphopantothenoylcysteine decarboxylase/phosphopantothenate--cysteine ligase CoaBC [Candidatus Bathyarchaeum tardum]WGM90459.1 MAG: bifunctional phosphopantothenoylcysteine decarboxylase/phosphopantothenate--cysteine ligase CoaBC [Candidatus Bathyarchaeum tardum]
MLTDHPSKDIVGTKGTELKGKNVVLCISGSVAAVRCSDIARELMRHGADVFPVMSQMSQKIIHPYLMEWATGNPVVTELTGKIEHVALTSGNSTKADLILFAPATANTISKIACGIDDTPITSVATTAFGLEIPIMIVSAMHGSMYQHPILLENIKKLKSLGVKFIGPRIEGKAAKIAETEEIVNSVINELTVKKDLIGKKILVTAGPTLEYIDPVRVLTNKSSGKMGLALVNEALSRGAQVTLISGPISISPPHDSKVINVETTSQMHEAVVSELTSKKYDIVIAAAAASDWTPEKTYDYKVPTRESSKFTLNLKSTSKIINAVKKVSPETFLVTFKAEYNISDEELIKTAYERLEEPQADLIAANDVGRKGAGFAVDTNELFIIDKERNVVRVPTAQKRAVAKQLLDVIVKKLV